MSALAARYDAVVVGAGPNGLAAAITLARADRSVLLVEANPTIGGGCRSEALTLPGFVHDVCSAVHPLAIASPFFRTIPLDEHGVKLDHPPLPLAHPLDGGVAAVLARDLEVTRAGLGADGDAYGRLMSPLVRNAGGIVADVIGPLRFPRHPLQSAAFGRYVPYSAERLVRSRFSHAPARALLGGIAAHAFLPLDRIPTAAFGLLLGLLGHAYGWPVVRGGSQRLSDALATELTRLGGEIVTGWRVASLDELPPSDAVLLDLTPRQVLAVTGDRLPARYRRRLARFRYGPGVFKVDWALDGPIPWTAEACSRAGTVHVVGDLDDILAAERDVAAERIPARPFVLLAQPSVADATRAPEGTQTIWAYCHVPHGSPVDMTDAVEAQIERFAPGFRDRVLARSVLDPAAIEHHNANHVGGDINGGIQDLGQLVRPVLHFPPYATPDPRIWLCSSSTPPGGGVHGMCGAAAAESLLRRARRSKYAVTAAVTIPEPPSSYNGRMEDSNGGTAMTAEDEPTVPPGPPVARDAAYWAAISRLAAVNAPDDAINLNVTGKRVASPIQGFGRLWQKTFTARLIGSKVTPAELIALWKAEYGSFWPKGSRFYGSLTGIKPGETALLNLDLPMHLQIATGVLVLYADDESFTFMTPEGHGFAGFITFSAASQDGVTVAQVTALLRAADPIGEMGMLFGVDRLENRNWEETLRNLGRRAGAQEVEITLTRTLVDRRRQWQRFGNVWQNSMIRTVAYTVTHPRRRFRTGK